MPKWSWTYVRKLGAHFLLRQHGFMRGPTRRTLARALEIMGTKERLAEALGVPVAALEGYLNGEDAPYRIFFKALDIVARGPRGNDG